MQGQLTLQKMCFYLQPTMNLLDILASVANSINRVRWTSWHSLWCQLFRKYWFLFSISSHVQSLSDNLFLYTGPWDNCFWKSIVTYVSKILLQIWCAVSIPDKVCFKTNELCLSRSQTDIKKLNMFSQHSITVSTEIHLCSILQGKCIGGAVLSLLHEKTASMIG